MVCDIIFLYFHFSAIHQTEPINLPDDRDLTIDLRVQRYTKIIDLYTDT